MNDIPGNDLDWLNEPSPNQNNKKTRGKPLVWIPSKDQANPKWVRDDTKYFTGGYEGKQYIGEPVSNLKKKKQPSIEEFREVTGL